MGDEVQLYETESKWNSSDPIEDLLFHGDAVLEHYGVKGMKWGVRKDRSSGGSSTKSAKSSTAGMNPATRDALALPAAYAATFITLYGAKKAINYLDSGKIQENKQRGKAFLTRSPVANWKVNPKLSNKNLTPDQIHSSVVKHINPDYPAPGTKMNCRRATMAYELRRRGYDVSATKSRFATGQDFAGLRNATSGNKNSRIVRSDITGFLFHPSFKRDYKKTDGYGQQKVKPNAKDIFDTIGKQPKGARGELTIGLTIGGRHSVAWENVKGKPVVFDTQSNEKFDVKSLDKKWPAKALNGAGITRLDNAPINKEFLLRWVENA